jgi:hypothetical protein
MDEMTALRLYGSGLTLALMRMVSNGRGTFCLGDQRQPVMADP